MSLKGQTLWKRGFVAQPHMTISLNEGENLDQALERMTRPNIGIFSKAKFSPYVAKPGKANAHGAYGVSRLTAAGLVDSNASNSEKTGSFE
jgi:hypothetical protein